MKGQTLDILVGAATIAIGYTLGAVIYSRLNIGSATKSTTDISSAPIDMPNGMQSQAV
jgi:hypothetical protein